MDLLTITTWLNENPSLITLSVGLFVFIVYRIEKIEAERSAADVILEELRTIEKSLDVLKETGDFFSVTPISLSTKGWVQYRGDLGKRFDFDDRGEISRFYSRIDSLREMLEQHRSAFFKSMEAKSQAMQTKLIEIAESAKSQKDFEEKKKQITDIVHPDSYWFSPSAPKEKIKNLLTLLTPLSTGIIGKKLKNISEQKWFLPFWFWEALN